MFYRIMIGASGPLKSTCFILTLLGFVSACASYTEDTKEVRSLYRSGAWAEALVKLEKSSHLKEDKNKLLFRLEKAMILDKMGERSKARAALIEADKIADALFTTSISRTAASFIVNEASSDYAGEDYEKVAIHTMLALSFIEDKDYSGALVEARKINNKLNEINQGYEDKKNKYGEDGFARYLAAIIYESKGEIDSAIVDYTKALDLFAGDYRLFAGGVPDDLVKSLYHLLVERNRTDRVAQLTKSYPKQVAAAKSEGLTPKGGAIVVVHELGHIATKSTEEFVIPVGGQVVRFSFPVIRTVDWDRYNATGITLGSSGKFHSGDFVQNLDAIAKHTLDDRRGRYFAKQAARLLAKGQLTEQAYRNFGPLGGIAANVYSAVSETADTRSWTLLPAAIFITRINVKPGVHDITIKTDGKVEKISSINVKKGEVVILR